MTRLRFAHLSAACLAVVAASLVACPGPTGGPGGPKGGGRGDEGGTIAFGPRADDWTLPTADDERKMRSAGAPGGMPPPAPPMSAAPAMAEGAKIGFAVGGAKDVGNFRENVKRGFLPLPTDVTYEGLFYDYSFDTGKMGECKKLFCPSYVYARARDPFSGEIDHYLTVGLNSGMKESDFSRKRLNLVIVLDISGSMSSSFSEYYYDRFGKRVEAKAEKGEDRSKSKMRVANEALVSLLGHLRDEDRLGIVLFDDNAYVAKRLRYVGETDMEKLKGHILEISPRGGTNMSAGMRAGTELLGEFSGADSETHENRIIFLTDAMPNLGETGEDSLLGITGGNAERRIYSTFIGIGVDFNTELIEAITKIRGANYYAVHSSNEFKRRLDDEFDFMVTPLVFDLRLTLAAEGYAIEKVYGSPEASEATGELMKVNTLFPSKVEAGETRGGVVLIKLRKVGAAGAVKLRTAYRDRSGREDGDEARIVLEEGGAETFPNTGIRKAILLARYADLLRNWIIDERKAGEGAPFACRVEVSRRLVVPEDVPLGRWERTSVPLTVAGYVPTFTRFRAYYEAEAGAIGDPKLKTELEVLEQLIAAAK